MFLKGCSQELSSTSDTPQNIGLRVEHHAACFTMSSMLMGYSSPENPMDVHTEPVGLQRE